MIDAPLPLLPFRLGLKLEPTEARELARLLDEGLLQPVLADVVVAAATPVDAGLRACALRLLVPDRLHERGAAVSEQAAAWLWCGGPPPTVVDVAVAPGRGRVIVPYLAVHERRMPPDDVTTVMPPDGVALTVTTGVRTAADLLRALPPPTALDAAVRVAAATGATAPGIARCLDLMPRARGVARARRLLRDWPDDAPPGAPGEDQSMRLPVTR
jgi:hypothetical protein